MTKTEQTLKLAIECTYADEMMDSAKTYLRNVLNEALEQLYKLEGAQRRSIGTVTEGGRSYQY
jgi:hypothetical protein